MYPLLLFYILSILNFILRLYYCIYAFKIKEYSEIIPLVTPATIKAEIALTQILAMMELTIRIKSSLEVRFKHEIEAQIMQKRKDNIILGMRIGTTLFIIVGLVLTAYFNRSWTIEVGESRVEAKAEYLKHAARVFSYVFLVVTILLAVSIGTLLYMLHVKFSVN